MKQETEQSKNHNFVFYSLRISFYYLVIMWILFAVFDVDMWEGTNAIITLLWFISGIWTFVVSIIHLNVFKQKAFAITALVISSIFLLESIIGFVIGFMIGAGV